MNKMEAKLGYIIHEIYSSLIYKLKFMIQIKEQAANCKKMFPLLK